MTLRIKNWDLHYENNKTRILKNMSWVPFPNSHDSDGFTEIMEEKDGVSIFGAWVLIVQIASKCGPRGTLVRSSGEEHNHITLSRMSRCPISTMKRALEITQKVGWIEEIDENGVIRHLSATSRHFSAKKERKKERTLEISKVVIDYLNEQIKTKFKFNSDKTLSFISARLEEGFELEAFKKVIRVKKADWVGTEQEKYLRPSTLFGPRFEGYFNQKENENSNIENDQIEETTF